MKKTITIRSSLLLLLGVICISLPLLSLIIQRAVRKNIIRNVLAEDVQLRQPVNGGNFEITLAGHSHHLVVVVKGSFGELRLFDGDVKGGTHQSSSYGFDIPYDESCELFVYELNSMTSCSFPVEVSRQKTHYYLIKATDEGGYLNALDGASKWNARSIPHISIDQSPDGKWGFL